ncbi:hypothetical protein YPPY66_2308, partial [Yersinia pestis PY-66]
MQGDKTSKRLIYCLIKTLLNLKNSY